MPTSGKLLEAAKERGWTVRQLCDWAVTTFGSEYLAAVALKCYPNAIRHHRTKPNDPRRAATRDAGE